MRKKQSYNPLQLSLFGELEIEQGQEPKDRLEKEWESAVKKNSLANITNNENERHVSESSRRKRESVHAAGERGHGTEINTSLGGESIVRNDKRTTTQTLRGNEERGNTRPLPDRNSDEPPARNVQSNEQWEINPRSQRNLMATVSTDRWTNLKKYEDLLDFEITGIPDRADNSDKYLIYTNFAKSQPKLIHNHQLAFNERPDETDLYKAVINIYKDIINNHKSANDEKQQSLFDHASDVIAKVNQFISTERETTTTVEYSVNNYHTTVSPLSGSTFSKTKRLQNNINALDTLIKLQREKRPPTTEEQHTLAQYVGWGGLKEIQLDPKKEADWQLQSDINLRKYVSQVYEKFEILDPDGSRGLFDGAKRSILSAHFTSYPVINAIYKAIEKAGFQGGNILEPSAGIGNFLAAMPKDIANNAEVTAVEMDPTSGAILQKLFPTAETYTTPLEKITLPENHYDLILSNIPFGQVKIFDPQVENNKDKCFGKASSNIHNYFFAKSMLMAKPGAMIAFITSRYTLDSKTNRGIRQLMNDHCRFCGAIRLPDNAFKSNAGTEVVSDIIFLKKYNVGESKSQEHNFLDVKDTPYRDANNVSGIISYNQYFHDNPQNLLGKIEFGGQYREEEFNLKGGNEADLYDQITKAGNRIFDIPVLNNVSISERTQRIEAEIEHFIAMGPYDAIGNLVVLDGGFIGAISDKFHINEELDQKVRNLGINPNTIRHDRNKLSSLEEESIRNAGINIDQFYYRVVEAKKISKKDIPKVKYIHSLREKTKELIFKETTGGYSDIALNNLRGNLFRIYKEFTFKYGNIQSANNDKIQSLDADKYIIGSLEKRNSITGKIEPADILLKRTIHPVIEIRKTDNIQDAITISLQKYGSLKMNYVAELMDKTYEEIMNAQHGDNTYIFKDETGNHLTREDYLSGNVVKKLAIAKKIAETNPAFQNNVDQLEAVQPEKVPAVDIYSPLHSRWVPENYVQRFLQHLLKTDHVTLNFSKSSDLYKIDINDYDSRFNIFSTNRKTASWIINHALNGVEPKVTYLKEDNEGKKIQVFDPEDTQLAKENYRKIREAWDDWKYQDSKRREHIETIYNKTFNNTILRNYNGSKMQFPGLIGFTLRPHQKDAVFRNIQKMGGINDHMVGAGKTLVQVATAMELRRLGIASKPMIIGLKSQIPQLYEQFKQAYPLSKVLFPSEKDFVKKNRKRLLNNIATNDWDCIIISHDQFTRIQQPEGIQIKLIEELTVTIKDELYSAVTKREKRTLENRLYNYEQKIEKLKNSAKDKDVLDFSQLGVDFLMVDESQEFKNLEFSTTKKNVKGLGNPMGSKRAFNLLVAARYLQDFHNGDKGILFSSGTPISNTMAELYLLFKYLRPHKMKEMGLTSFDSWAANFANDFSDLEYYMGRFKEVHRFREFVNLPELLTIYREIADVRNDTNLSLDKPSLDHQLVKIAPSQNQLSLIEKLQEYINTKGNDYAGELGLTAGYDDQRGMNPSFAILAINFAKKMSLDPRLINPAYEAGTKLTAAANNIGKIYNDTSDIKGTQLVFCDIGTPKSMNIINNIYDHLSGEITISEMEDIFGEDYFERKTKPKLSDVTGKISSVLHLDAGEINDLINEANRSQKFTAYTELKRLLTEERGIPANEIVFIHSYNSRKQKETLFEAVNKGAIRILLGSTKKLGTGVNVQKKCVALHHLDVTWRPADLDQRNGRGARQGNEAIKILGKGKIPAYYYATERTLDASMYNTTAQKAKFIAQLKTTDTNLRTIKDIEEDIDMGNMAAELSGDPIFKEKAMLTKKVQELEQLEKSFKAKKYSTEDKLKNSKTLLSYYKERTKVLQNILPLLDGIPKNKENEVIFSAKLENQMFSKVGEYGMAMIAEAEHRKKYGSNGDKFSLGEVWGFKVIGSIEDTWHDGKHVNRVVLAPLGDKITPISSLPSGSIAAALQVKTAILEMPEELERIKRKAAKEEGNIIELQNKLNQEFPYKDELNSKKDRLTEVNKIIKQKILETEKNKIGENFDVNVEGDSQEDQNTLSEKVKIMDTENAYIAVPERKI